MGSVPGQAGPLLTDLRAEPPLNWAQQALPEWAGRRAHTCVLRASPPLLWDTGLVHLGKLPLGAGPAPTPSLFLLLTDPPVVASGRMAMALLDLSPKSSTACTILEAAGGVMAVRVMMRC